MIDWSKKKNRIFLKIFLGVTLLIGLYEIWFMMPPIFGK